MNLFDLCFTDLFVCAEASEIWFKATADALDKSPVPDECREELALLRCHLLADGFRDSGKVDWEGDGTGPLLRLRIQRMDTVAGGPVFVCGRPVGHIPTMVDLGVPQALADRLLQEELRDGLILLMGRTRAGKSMVAAALVAERIAKHGGVAWTVESPVELPIHGPRGRGHVYQTEVTSEREFGPAIRKMLRASSDLMMIGEVRDDVAASEAVLAAMSGRLVVTTFHGASVAAGLERFADMCGGAARLATALRAVVHMRLQMGGPAGSVGGRGAPARRALSVVPLIIPTDDADTIRSHIRGGRFAQLASEIERQKRMFMQSEDE